jgi:hypothetical protein
VPIETFDAMMLRLWRNIDTKSEELDAQVRKLKSTSVSIPLPQPGSGKPVLRLNALPVLSMPEQYLELSFKTPKDWDAIRKACSDSHGNLILTKAEAVSCWGTRALIKQFLETTFCLRRNAICRQTFARRTMCTSKGLLKKLCENFFCATACPHFHEFPCFVSSYFTSSPVVFLMSLKTCLLASSR